MQSLRSRSRFIGLTRPTTSSMDGLDALEETIYQLKVVTNLTLDSANSPYSDQFSDFGEQAGHVLGFDDHVRFACRGQTDSEP